MEISFTAIFSRHSLDVLWWHEYAAIHFPEYVDYVRTKFQNTGKLTVDFTESADKLTLLRLATFSSPEEESSWNADEYVQTMSEVREMYYLENNISRIS